MRDEGNRRWAASFQLLVVLIDDRTTLNNPLLETTSRSSRRQRCNTNRAGKRKRWKGSARLRCELDEGKHRADRARAGGRDLECPANAAASISR